MSRRVLSRIPPRVKVVRVIARLNFGGPAQQALLLTAHLPAEGFETVLVVGVGGEREGAMTELACTLGVRPLVITSLQRAVSPWRDLLAFLSLVRILVRERPDVLHTHTAKAGALGRVAGRLVGVPLVVHTFHGHVLSGYFPSFASRIALAMERALAGITDRLVTVAEPNRDELLALELASPGKMRTIPLGLELRPFLELEPDLPLRAALSIPATAGVVAMVARLVPIKDVPTFLRAARLVHDALPDVHFVLAGDGELRPELEALARTLGLSARVHFLGNQADLRPLYRAADVVALTSRNEGSPVALLEAMAAGIPVVATAVGGVPAVVGGYPAASLVAAGDHRALAAALCDLLGEGGGSRRRLAPELAAARRRVVLRHSRERLVSDLALLYRTVRVG